MEWFNGCQGSQRYPLQEQRLGREWLKRYHKEGTDGLKNTPKSGRPADMSKEAGHQIKKEMSDSKQDWTTKQVEELIVGKSGTKCHCTCFVA